MKWKDQTTSLRGLYFIIIIKYESYFVSKSILDTHRKSINVFIGKI